MLSQSTSRLAAAPTPSRMAPARMASARVSRRPRGRVLLSRTPSMGSSPGGNTTAAATTGPARGPRPASSTPTSSRRSAHARRSRSSVGTGHTAQGLRLGLLLVFLLADAGAFAGKRLEEIELGAPHPAPPHRSEEHTSELQSLAYLV